MKIHAFFDIVKPPLRVVQLEVHHLNINIEFPYCVRVINAVKVSLVTCL